MQQNEAAGLLGGFFLGTCAVLASVLSASAASSAPFTVDVTARTHHAQAGESISFGLAFYNGTREPRRLFRYAAQSMVDLCVWQIAVQAPSPPPSPTPAPSGRPWVELSIVDPRIYTVSGEQIAMQRARMNAPLVGIVPAADVPANFKPAEILVGDSDEWFEPDRLTYRFDRAGTFVVGAVPSRHALGENGATEVSCSAHPYPGTPQITVTEKAR